ncbi:MAG: DUF2384 domain-containing protein [Gammaproteobacteria bacterium]|nr:DUF2384 domain-containing protein [Gammaproteobacteria bacterium]
MSAKAFKNMEHDECVTLTRMIMSILDSWGLNGQAQMSLLDLPKGIPVRALRRYREDTPFPDEAAVYERVDHIVGIYDALRTTYPHNPPMGALWMKQRNVRFQDQSPLQVIVEEGLAGLVRIRTHLDCTYDWKVNP